MRNLKALLLGTALVAPIAVAAPAPPAAAAPGPYQRVLLLSIDGMHANDLSAWFHYARFGIGNDALRNLSQNGSVYMNAFTSAPSDSFPGLLAQVTGATPKTSGVYYDASYDRTLYAPQSNCVGNPGTAVIYDESIDKDSTRLDAGGTLGKPKTQIDNSRLPMKKAGANCTPVLPHDYLLTNTVFEEIHRQLGAGARTAWADKHPAYEILNGPSGTGVDDLYTPEIAATANTTAGTDYTQSYIDARRYDDMKVKAVINQIDGFASTDDAHATPVGVPVLFGMNFQALSVGQKLAVSGPSDPTALVGGYTGATPKGAMNGKCKLPGWWNSAIISLQFGCPGITNPLTQLGQLDYISYEVGLIISELQRKNLAATTLVIVSAKHGQSPIDPKVRKTADKSQYNTFAHPAFGSYDDVALLWLDPNTRTTASYKTASQNLAKKLTPLGLQTLLTDVQIATEFNSPWTDSRAPDFIGLVAAGTIYTSGTKLAEHGGWSDEDRNVALMVANPPTQPNGLNGNLASLTNAQPVETRQIAPTILKALGLDYAQLQGVAREGTKPLPVVFPSAP